MNDNTLNSGSLLQGDKYKIIGVLGQGGFGITYEAEQVSLGRKVAVKEFFMKDICNRDEATSQVSVPSIGSKELVEKFRAKFIREARMIAGLDHEHIVKIHDVFEENGTAYYVMEYLSGGSLDRKIKERGSLPESEALGFIRQIADALSYLHSQNILHFDVKPSNVLLGKNDSTKLIDFGISKHYDESGVQTSSTPVGISKGYAPLEQYKQGSDINSFTPATDVYALGATLYALLAGANPPEASDVNDDGLPVIDGITPNVMHAIEKAMQPRRKDRPQSVEEFLQLLDSSVGDDDEETIIPGAGTKEANPNKKGPAKKPDKPQKPSDPKHNGFPKWLYGVFAGIVVAILAVVLLNRLDKQDVPDLQQIDSTALVADAVPETPATSQPSEPALKPESPAKPEAPTIIELKSISLSKTALELEEGSSATLTVKYTPSDATDKSTTWKSSDTGVAKVTSSGKVTAVKSGSATIIATCGGKDAYCNVTIKAMEVQPSRQETVQTVEPSPATSSVLPSSQPTTPATSQSSPTTGMHNGHEYVDLGLSVKWATCNVGASSPEGYGSYFAWGETSSKSDYRWESLKYRTEGFSAENLKFSKYVTNSKYGPVDNKKVLDLSDDAAHVNFGGSWRMPTDAEWTELRNNCTWTWTSNYNGTGVAGRIVISKKSGYTSNFIFLPAAGYCYPKDIYNAKSCGYYWSSSLESDGPTAWMVFVGSGSVSRKYGGRYCGQSVRPVCP